ncbi:hypothetical protein [Duganella callida]|uniref:N-acetyltransferase domain-containing protein n=1 Tax=Duganella callida TaxID=2561932 RepID=A0A4Y9SMU5_9BURK|nr:hypothetical protein [Duganella callida]TFW27982.1 hypothetical protein E4L98_06120 [Duganella callida]
MHHTLDLSERLEIQSRRYLYAAAPAGSGGAVTGLPGTAAAMLLLSLMPSPIMNRVIGLPGDAPLAPSTLASIRQAFRKSGLPHFWIHAWDLPGHATLRDSLAAQGGELQGGWTKFLYELDALTPPPATDTPLYVRAARPDEAGVSGQIICRSFGMPDTLLPWMSAFVGRPQWQVFLACGADDVPVASGAVLIAGAQAWLGIGATLPEARGQGAQQLLLATRLAAAKAAGCRLASIETEAAEPGEHRHSLSNIRRAGFREVGTRLNYLFKAD